MAVEGTAPADSFSVSGQLDMAFFPTSEDAYHSRIDGERIETLIARMLGFPNEAELDRALSNGVSADPNDPSIVRSVPRVSISVWVDNEPLV